MLWAAFRTTQTQASDTLPMARGQHCLRATLTDGMLKEPQESKMGWEEHVLGLSLWALGNEVRSPLWTCQKY